jgi:hypothetical protein
LSKRIVLALAVATIAAAGAVTAVLAFRPDDGNGEGAAAARVVDPAECRRLVSDEARGCYARAFSAMVREERDPRPVVETIADMAWSQGGYLLANCHGVMHTVGRRYAQRAGVSLANLMNYLPQTNDPGCPAGFAHGLVTAVGPDIDTSRPRQAEAVCANAGTRYQRYSCTHGLGHAFMRLYSDTLRPALGLCRTLGRQAAPDCAQGAYHDYWFAVAGADDATLPEGAATDPRRLCGSQPERFVRPCWYRAFVDNRPEGAPIESPEELDALCDGLGGLQRSACVTGASVIGPPDPAAQLLICAGLAEPWDAGSCVRGTKVQNLLEYPTSAHVDLISRCAVFTGAPRAACFRWLGKTLAVLTDGKFARAGCPRLGSAGSRRLCREGARSMDEALVTFS